MPNLLRHRLVIVDESPLRHLVDYQPIVRLSAYFIGYSCGS